MDEPQPPRSGDLKEPVVNLRAITFLHMMRKTFIKSSRIEHYLESMKNGERSRNFTSYWA